MAHSFQSGKWNVIHNGDFSGLVTISDSREPDKQFSIPFSLMKAVVAEAIRQQKISEIEQMSDSQIIKSIVV